ncbi:MAG: hypothetical protein QGG40_11430, partial [Myxococcota bacterium]|nr:hypothetical protein [Myxococcota bacterium]
ATMPGLPDDAVTMPALLSQPGTLRILGDDQSLATDEDLKQAVVRLDEGGMPYTLLEFDAPIHQAIAEAVDASRALSIEMDGSVVARAGEVPPMTDGELRLPPGTGETRVLLRRATDRAIVLDNGPLPCPVRLGSVDPAS